MNATAKIIEIGTRIHCVLPHAGHGTVYAIDGEQRPETCRVAGGIVHMGGRASFGVVFDNGALSQGVPESIIRGVQWRIFDEVASPERIAAALAHSHCQRAAAAVAADNAKARFALAVDQLRTDPAHDALVKADDRWSGKTAAKNIRIELRAAFGKAVKFSVRNRDHGSISIDWTDGPTAEQVEAITKKYQSGSFNGMEDIYEDAASPWNHVFGGARYVFTHRDFSAAHIERAIGAVFERYAGNFADSGITATAEDFQRGRLWSVSIPGLGDALDTAIRSTAATMAG